MTTKKTTPKKSPEKQIDQDKLNERVADSIEKANSPSLPTRADHDFEEKKSFREQMGPAEAFGIPCLVTIILILLFMVFIGVVVKLSLNSAGL